MSMKSFLYYFYCFSIFILLFLTKGCATLSVSAGGGLQESLEVENLFESGTLLADHVYYTDGSPSNPDAIIAIDKNFQLQTKIWSRRDWTEKDLKDTVFWMQTEEVAFCTNNGGLLIAPDGQQIGIWYSKRSLSRIRQPAEGIVEVFPFEYIVGSPCWRQAVADDR